MNCYLVTGIFRNEIGILLENVPTPPKTRWNEMNGLLNKIIQKGILRPEDRLFIVVVSRDLLDKIVMMHSGAQNT